MVARGLKVRQKRVVGDKHLKLKLGDYDAIAFGLGELAAQLPDEVDVAFHLTRNRYQGRDSLELKVEDLRRPS